MKTSYLALRFLRRNGFPFAVICLVMTAAVALLISAASAYQYQAVTRDALNGEVLQNAVFCTMHAPGYSDESSQAIPEDVLNSPAYGGSLLIEHGGIIELNGNVFVNLRYCSRAVAQSFLLPMHSGRRLDPNAEKPEAVLSAYYRNMLALGDSLLLPDGSTAVIVGFVKEGIPFPSLSSWGSASSASDLYKGSMDIALVYAPDRPQEKVSNLVMATLIRPDAPEEEQTALRKKLFAYDSAVSYDTLLERTDQALQQMLREMLPLPVFLLVVSTVSMMSVAALAIDRSMSEQSKYFLLGCSKRRSIGYISIALSAVFSLPIVINLVLNAVAPDFLRFDPKAYLIGAYAILPVALYWLMCLSLTVSMPVLLFGRYSPLTFYKRNL